MKKFFNWILVLGACVGAVYLIGLIVPRTQTHSSKSNLVAKPAEAYAVVADLAGWRNWFPGIAAMRERPAKGDRPQWTVTPKEGPSYDLEVQVMEEDKTVQCLYTIDDTRYTVRFDFMWCGEGARVRVSTTSDTRDTWKCAKHFLLPSAYVSPLAALNALAVQLGEEPKAEEDD